MNPARWTALAALLAAGCGGPCDTVETDRRGADGSISFVNGAGVAFTAARATIERVSGDGLTLYAAVKSADGDERDVSIELRGLAAGTTTALPPPAGAPARARVCVSLTDGLTCMDASGSVATRTLSANCYEHESGVSLCAENVDAAVQLTASSQGTSVSVDLNVVSVERWAKVACTAD